MSSFTLKNGFHITQVWYEETKRGRRRQAPNAAVSLIRPLDFGGGVSQPFRSAFFQTPLTLFESIDVSVKRRLCCVCGGAHAPLTPFRGAAPGLRGWRGCGGAARLSMMGYIMGCTCFKGKLDHIVLARIFMSQCRCGGNRYRYCRRTWFEWTMRLFFCQFFLLS